MIHISNLFLYRIMGYLAVILLFILNFLVFDGFTLARDMIGDIKMETRSEQIKLLRTTELYKNISDHILVSEIISKSVVGLRAEESERLSFTIVEEGRKYGIDPLLILALIKTESTFYPKARSVVGAKGLMQVRYFVGKALAKELGITWKGNRALYDPVTNVKLGSFYLFKLLKQFNNLHIALTAYNYGPTYIKKIIAKGYNPPVSYSRTVLSNYKRLIEESSLAGLKRFNFDSTLLLGPNDLISPELLVESLQYKRSS